MKKRGIVIALGIVLALEFAVSGFHEPRLKNPGKDLIQDSGTSASQAGNRSSEDPAGVRNPVPSFPEQVAVLEALPTKELDRRLQDVQARLESEHWIERANFSRLKEDERREMLALIREQGAIHAVRAERIIRELN